MDSRAQVQFEYLLSIVLAFAVTVVVIFFLFNFAGQIRTSILGESVEASNPTFDFLTEESKFYFISGMVVLYLVEHSIFAFFYFFLGKSKGARRPGKLSKLD